MKPEVKKGIIYIAVAAFGFIAFMAVLAYISNTLSSEFAIYKTKYEIEKESMEEAAKSQNAQGSQGDGEGKSQK